MNRAARSVLRKLGADQSLENEREQRIQREVEEAKSTDLARKDRGSAGALDDIPEELRSETEKRHEKYRRKQAMAGRFTPAAERLPIMTSEARQERDKDRPNWRPTSFEGPIEKLIEKYKELDEVQRHLTLGQSMKYEFTADGRVLDRDGNLIYDGENIVGPS